MRLTEASLIPDSEGQGVPEADPFAVLETEAPRLAEKEILEKLREHYGFEVRLEALPGERDQNFRLQCNDGRRYVLKIANSAEDRLATDFQVQALLHLESHKASHDDLVTVPEVVRTRDGRTSIVLDSGGDRYVARIVTWLDGKPLGATPASPELCRRIGACLAHLGQALRDFDHPGSSHALLWDMRHAPALRKILSHVEDPESRFAIAGTLDAFEASSLPRFGDVRSQVIHGDLNPDNVLIDPDDPTQVTGVIDFGDMSKAPLIVDVAVAASYLRAAEGNPLASIAEFLSAYHSVTPLELAEIDMLFDLIKTRLAASVAIKAWRATLRSADDPCLAGAAGSGPGAGEFLLRLLEIPRDHARRVFRQVCASTAS